jgi:TonB family protein
MMSQGTAARPDPKNPLTDVPFLLWELPPWHRGFFRNLADLFRSAPPPLELTAEPIPVGPDTFIRTGINPRRFAESGAYHIALVVAVYVICTLPLLHRAPQLRSPFENTKVEYYPVSEYLPPVNTGKTDAPKSRKGSPKLAKQEILSVPPQPDNAKQTVITPPKIKLQQDVALPNIVAWTALPGQPIAASSQAVNKLTVPQFDMPVVEPRADVSKLRANSNTPVLPQLAVVEPTADVSKVKPKLEFPALPQVSVVEPPLSPDQLKLKAGQINMAQMEPLVSAPKLPVPAQQASGTAEAAGPGKGTAQGVPPPPSVANLPSSSRGQGQLIALGLNPADVHGPLSVPSGNRSGEFHASPGGKPDAPGTPNITGNGASNEPPGTGKGTGAPPGIFVANPPPGATTSAVAGTPTKLPASDNSEIEARKRIIAAAMPPSLPNVNHRTPAEPPPPLSDVDHSVEQKVFGKKPYYSVILNMPNLTSATGSWIIRYAELKWNQDKIALTAPVATTKVDPAYPPDVLRDRVEGTVTLYAVIHIDGSVSNIRVLDSLDSRLDDNAIRALSRWRFQPGMKNGQPVEIEAVVQIPFRMRRFQ